MFAVLGNKRKCCRREEAAGVLPLEITVNLRIHLLYSSLPKLLL
jgi:hypothetical protein